MFFDSAVVLKKTDAATHKVLGRFGAYVRQTARQSIRNRKGSSKSGSPPTNQTGLLKYNIYFGYDPERQSVVIGPAKLNKGTPEALAALEYGGTSTMTTRKGKKKRITVAARPFMGPAYEKEQPKLPAMWAGSIK